MTGPGRISGTALIVPAAWPDSRLQPANSRSNSGARGSILVSMVGPPDLQGQQRRAERQQDNFDSDPGAKRQTTHDDALPLFTLLARSSHPSLLWTLSPARLSYPAAGKGRPPGPGSSVVNSFPRSRGVSRREGPHAVVPARRRPLGREQPCAFWALEDCWARRTGCALGARGYGAARRLECTLKLSRWTTTNAKSLADALSEYSYHQLHALEHGRALRCTVSSPDFNAILARPDATWLQIPRA
ncbi:hypothetical protein B0H15DRAFT_539863 [Mycena belliarum]|uniref:Uncharacterized protein n=1 Tax=Mycena belliarum TaxID=1033014 RepID=A0AAD6TTR4_9AGAR|nr:hypothetical protein B0H15DRAFT_539863 [Mycena belliae]